MKIKELLHNIYNAEDAYKAQAEIENCVEKYRPLIHKTDYKLSQKDVILITYGDQVQHEGETTLKTLKRFADNYLNPEINSIHILPFYPYTSDDGFSVTDYKKVNNNLGSWSDIEALTMDYRIMFDAVINHISKSSAWFREYLNENSDFANYFIDTVPNADLSKVMRPRDLPLLTSFTSKSGQKLNIWTTFSEDQVDLNYQNYKVLIAILDILLFYISKGAKLIRLDAIGFMWKKIGTTCMHLPEVHHIIQLYRAVINELAPDVVMITETNVPHKENISYFGNGYDEAQMVYNFTLPPLLAYSIHQQNTSKLTHWAQTLKLSTKETCFFNFTASHDGVGVRPLKGIVSDNEILDLAHKAEEHGGFVSYKTNGDGSKEPYELNCGYLDLITHPKEDDLLKTKRFLLTQAVMLTFPGVPGIYFHSIVGSQNDYEGVEKSGIKRRINRKKLLYSKLAGELENKTVRKAVYQTYKKLLKVRSREKLFNPFGDFKFLTLSDKLFVIKRTSQETNEELLAVFNFSAEPQAFIIPKGKKFRCLQSNKIFIGRIFLPGFDFLWLKA